jgi:hypothetical protein
MFAGCLVKWQVTAGLGDGLELEKLSLGTDAK